MDNVVLIFIAIFVTFAINAVPDKVLSPAAKYIVTFLTILFFIFIFFKKNIFFELYLQFAKKTC